MKSFLCLCFFVTGTFLLPSQTELRPELEKLLPPPKCKVDIMDVGFPKRLQELAGKMQIAISMNKDWFLHQVKTAKPGEPLPYNEKLGLTEKEYAEYLSLGEQAEMQKTATRDLKTTTNAGVFQFQGGADFQSLDSVKINLNDLTIITPFGTLNPPKPAESKEGGALGAYSGYRWELEEGDIEKGDITTASFLIGTLEKSGKRFIYYKGGVSKANNPVSNSRVIIFYEKN